MVEHNFWNLRGACIQNKTRPTIWSKNECRNHRVVQRKEKDVASKIRADVEPQQKLMQIKHLGGSFVRNIKYFTDWSPPSCWWGCMSLCILLWRAVWKYLSSVYLDSPLSGIFSREIFLKHTKDVYQKVIRRGLLGGSVAKNPPAEAGVMGLIPDPGGPHVPWSSGARTLRLPILCSRVCAPQQKKPLKLEAWWPRLEKVLAAAKPQHSQRQLII